MLGAERVGLGEAFRQPDRAQRQRDDLLHQAAGGEDDFGAAATDIDDGGQPVVEIEVAGHAAEGEPRLLLGRNHFDSDAMAPPGFTHEVAPIRRLAHGARRDRPQFGHAEPVGDRFHLAQRLQRLFHRPFTKVAAAV
jgi:hypothetical protein